jgi:hypothetical protein
LKPPTRFDFIKLYHKSSILGLTRLRFSLHGEAFPASLEKKKTSLITTQVSLLVSKMGW